MRRYALPQQDLPNIRLPRLAVRKNSYKYDRSLGIPLNQRPYLATDLNGAEWTRQLLDILFRARENVKNYLKDSPFNFPNDFSADLDTETLVRLTKAAGGRDMTALIELFDEVKAEIGQAVLPDLGPTGSPASIQDFKDLFLSLPLPEIALRFESDESFANNFVAGPNPCVIKRMNSVPSIFPISNEQLQSVPEFSNDDLAQAIAEGRIYFVDHTELSMLENGMHYGQTAKYIYAPLAAFAVPQGGGRLYPFAIQCGPTPEGRLIYTPVDGYSWKIAKNCVLAAHNSHHELSTHLGLTHYLMEPIVIATRRNLSVRHPVYALLQHHFEGTILINYAATNILLKPNKAVDRLLGSDLPSAYKFVAKVRQEYSFKNNYLPSRLRRLQTDDASLLTYYPYRDDGLLVWKASQNWMNKFVNTFYTNDQELQNDIELQAWAAEIASPEGGMIKDFGSSPGSIQSRQDLADILTMVIFTAGPQHAAVNFTQGTDMAFLPANPMAGYTPEPQGLGHTEEDWLKHLPPIEVGVTTLAILNLLAGVNYTQYGAYDQHPNGLMKDFNDGPIAEALKSFKTELQAIEQEIIRRNKSRFVPYIHLLPSRIPQSVNI